MQQNIAQHENEMIKIRQLIIARYATVSPVIKMSNTRGFGIHILNYFCLSVEDIENQCQKKPHQNHKSSFYFMGLKEFYFFFPFEAFSLH